MQDWVDYRSLRIDVLVWEIEEAVRAGNTALFLELSLDLDDHMQYAESFKRALAVAKAAQAARDRAALADEYALANDVEAAAERRALADEYAQAQGYPTDGSVQGIVASILDLFQVSTAAPAAGTVPASPFGELLAPVFKLFEASDQARGPNGKF
jgi:plasmid stabilization system protein ParE